MSTGSAAPDSHAHHLSIVVVGQATSYFLAISFLFCVLLVIVTPYSALMWFKIPPGVAPLSWTSVLLGVIETLIYGWYFALVFVPLYNWAASRRGR
jgi:hypothetical protein